MLAGVLATLLLFTKDTIKQNGNNKETNISQYVELCVNLSENKPNLRKNVIVLNEIKIGESINDKIIKEQLEKERQETLAREKERQNKILTESYTGHGTAIKLYESNLNNCVEFVKQKTGITHKLGSGGRGYIQGQEPKIGSIGVEAGKYPHAVLIVNIDNDKIIINESNYEEGWVTQRTLSRSDFLGFIYN